MNDQLDFALALSRRVLDGGARTEINPLVQRELQRLSNGGKGALDAIKKQGSLRNLTELPEELRRRFPIALEITPAYHVGDAGGFPVACRCRRF